MEAAQPLYDFAPLARMMLLGVLIALGPLAWVWHRNRQAPASRRIHALTVLTLFLTFDLVLFGSFTRLTDSGLGCPDWPGCYGSASPVGAHGDIAAAQAAMPTGPVTHGKAWVEMIHRYLATGVGVLIIVMTASAWIQARRSPVSGCARGLSPWWSTLTLVWVCIQGAFGAFTVTWKLFPAIVTLHLAGGVILLAMLSYQVGRQGQAAYRRPAAPVPNGLGWGLVVTLLLVALQVLLGGWVSTNYAVLACSTFPTCQGQWWPDMDFLQGFQIWRELGVLQDGSHISFAALTAIHYSHRLMAYVALSALLWLGWRMRGSATLRTPGWWLLALTLLQLLTGLSNVVLGWPLLAAVLHTGGAAALVAVLTWSLALIRLPSTEVSRVPRASKVSA